jgi:transcriptional regulator with XRE-family HTH domain
MADHTKPEVDLRQNFGQRLAIVRKLRGFSQEQLASISGLERSRISGIERGKANLTLNNIGLLAQALSVAPVELMDFHSQTVNEFKFAEPIENPKHEIDYRSKATRLFSRTVSG